MFSDALPPFPPPCPPVFYTAQHGQETPEEVVEDDNGYDDEGFEEYSDEFEGEGDEGSPAAPPPVAVRSPIARGGKAGGDRDGGAGAIMVGPRPSTGSRVVSPALKMRQTDDLETPDDKVLYVFDGLSVT